MAERQKPLLFRIQVINEDGTTEMKTVREDAIVVPNEYRHATLPPELTDRATKLWESVGKFGRPELDLAAWLNEFRRDAHPENEIAVWEIIQRALAALGGDKMRTMKKRQTVWILLAVSLRAVDIESQTGASTASIEKIRQAYVSAANTIG
jgi:hypothetical protein